MWEVVEDIQCRCGPLSAATAMALGGNVRVGLEDNLYLRAHVLAQSGADQVLAVRNIADALDIEIATAAKVQAIMGLKDVATI